jgi:murein DD-endopeptidase MepM/ murein hydrolase activator NlpD
MQKKPSAAAQKSQKKQQLKTQLVGKQQEIIAVQTELRAAKRDEEAIATELGQIETRLRSTRGTLAATKNHLEQARREQAKVQLALAKSQKALDDAERHLGERLAANYRQGPVRYASVLLGANTMGEMVSRAQLIRSIVKFEATLIAEIKASREAVLKWKAEVDQKAKQIEQYKIALGAQLDSEAKDVLRRREVLTEAKARRAEMEQEYATLESDSREIATRLKSLEVTSLSPAFSGKFIRPVDGPIVSRFGMRFHPILHYNRLHGGLDFGGGTGTPIRAAGSGTVAYASVMRGYGNVVVIEHGGGLSTLYGHCSVLLVSEGQRVEQGQMIAKIGMTGLATGPHLHFELRRGGSPIDPMGSGF